MDIATIVNLILCILSFILAVISILTVIFSLKQNNKMIENATRPYIAIYFDYSQMGQPIGYYVIRNFGNTSATIDSITYSDEIKNHPTNLSNLPAIFNSLIGNSIAPNQKIIAPFKVYDYNGNVARFDVLYHSNNKKYSEHFEIAVKNYDELIKPRVNSTSAYRDITYPLQEIAERLM